MITFLYLLRYFILEFFQISISNIITFRIQFSTGVLQLCLVVGSSFHYLRVSTQKSLDGCFSFTLMDGGSSQTVLVSQREKMVQF